VIRWRRNDLGDNTQIIAKEQRSKGRKHSDEELINLGLHDELALLQLIKDGRRGLNGSDRQTAVPFTFNTFFCIVYYPRLSVQDAT
jgi:hypothetical protein